MRRFFFPVMGNQAPAFTVWSLASDHTLPAAYITDTGHRSARRTATVFVIHFISGKCADLYEFGLRIDEILYPFTWRQFIFLVLFVDGFFSSPQSNLIESDF